MSQIPRLKLEFYIIYRYFCPFGWTQKILKDKVHTSAYSAISTVYKLEEITNLCLSSHFIHWKDEKSHWNITWHRLLQETGKEILEWRPSLLGYPNRITVKDTGLLGIHNHSPSLFLFLDLQWHKFYFVNMLLPETFFSFFTASLLLQSSALTPASPHSGLLPRPA